MRFPPGRNLRFSLNVDVLALKPYRGWLDLVVFKYIVFLAAAAVGALQAANQQQCDARRDDNGENGLVRREPVNKTHVQRPHSV
jgi:hypothetical protein